MLRHTLNEGEEVAERAGTAGLDQLRGGGALLGALAHRAVATRVQRRAKGRESGPLRADTSPHAPSIHGGSF